MTDTATTDTASPETCSSGGAPTGNRNAMRHGLRAGKLPAGCGNIENRINVFRRTLEDEKLAIAGEISIVDAAAINTACKWERHGMLALRWLRLEAEKLTASERLAFSREIARASAERDRALAGLELDRRPDPWDFLDSLPSTNGSDAPAGDDDAPAPDDAPHTPPSPSTSADASPVESSDAKGTNIPADANGSCGATEGVSEHLG